MTDNELSRRIAGLAERDERTRAARAERMVDIGNFIEEFPVRTMGLVGGGHEPSWLLIEALGCYRDGFFAAALICAHASCERELAGRLNHLGTKAPKGWERWGFGRMLEHAAEHEWFSPASQALLEELNRKRRDFYHFRPQWTKDSIVTRTFAQLPWRGKDYANEDMATVLRQDAFQALRAAFLIRHESFEDSADE